MAGTIGSSNARSHQFLVENCERREIGFCCQRQRRCRCLHERSCVGACYSENDRPLRVALNPSVRLTRKMRGSLNKRGGVGS
jgi:hypothetical protein